MKIAFILSFALIVLSFSGCCYFKSPPEPPYPNITSGWKDEAKKDGEFILKKDDVVSDGKLQFKITGLFAPKYCVENGSILRQGYATIQLIRVLDNRIVDDDYHANHGVGMVRIDDDDNAPPYYINIFNINYKDGWVHLRIRG